MIYVQLKRRAIFGIFSNFDLTRSKDPSYIRFLGVKGVEAAFGGQNLQLAQ